MTFLKVLRGEIASNFPILSLQLNVPFRPSSQSHHQHIDFQRSNYVLDEPIQRMIQDFNTLRHLMNVNVTKSSI